MVPCLGIFKFIYFQLTVCPCLASCESLNASVVCKYFKLVTNWTAGLVGLLLLIITGATLFIDTDFGGTDDHYGKEKQYQDLAKYGKKVVVSYMTAVFVTSYVNEIIIAALKFNFINHKSYNNPIFHIGKWHYEKEYYNGQDYIDYSRKSFIEKAHEMVAIVVNPMVNVGKKVANVFGGSKNQEIAGQTEDLSNEEIISRIGLARDSVYSLMTGGESFLSESFPVQFLKAIAPSPALLADTIS